MEHTIESNIVNANMNYNRTDKICSCGIAMIVRVNKSSGSKFLGCSGYPNCKNTMSICERNKIIKTTNKYTPIKLTSYVTNMTTIQIIITAVMDMMTMIIIGELADKYIVKMICKGK